MHSDLNLLAVFATVAEARNFRDAADRLGLTRSAVSQAVRRLEDATGIALVHRTTRSVGLTEAGRRLYEEVAPAMAGLRAALDVARHSGARPRGQLRLAVSSIAEHFLSGPMLAAFAAARPEITLDVLVTDEEIDIVAGGYDAGVRLGEVLEQDMIAVPVSDEQRQIAVCAPAYLAQRDAPTHPRDLPAHRCIGWRPTPQGAPYRWEFTEGAREFAVDVRPGFTTNDMRLMIHMALAGAGITIGMEESFRPYLDRGELVVVLEDFCPRFPGFFLYFPNRQNLAPKLRALLDFVQAFRDRPSTPSVRVRGPT